MSVVRRPDSCSLAQCGGVIFRDIDITKNLDQFNKPVYLALGKFDYLVAPFYEWNYFRPKFKEWT